MIIGRDYHTATEELIGAMFRKIGHWALVINSSPPLPTHEPLYQSCLPSTKSPK
jgi:hypothetical protein